MDAAVDAAADISPTALVERVTSLVGAHATEEGVLYEGLQPAPHRHVAATAWVFERFEALGLEPRIEAATVEGMEVTNVVAELPGDSDELVMVTAHHDVWFTSADDNSSGVVAMLAVAEALRDLPRSRTLRFVALDHEETVFGGALHHFGHLDRDVAAVINLDAIAYADRTPGSQSAPTGFRLPDTGDFLAVIGNEPADPLLVWAVQLGPELPHPLRVVSILGIGDNRWPLTGDLHRSDHTRPWIDGLPAAFLTDTADFRNDRYHTDGDTIDSLDPELFAGATELVIALAHAALEQP